MKNIVNNNNYLLLSNKNQLVIIYSFAWDINNQELKPFVAVMNIIIL